MDEGDREFRFNDADYFVGNIPRFTKHLSRFADRPCHILEIGVYEGRSTKWLLKNVARHSVSTITCVDPMVQPTFKTNFAGIPKVTLHEGYSREVLPTLRRSIYDFIYVDGSHRTIDVLEDAVNSFRLAKLGGIIAFDDYRWNDPVLSKVGGTPRPAIDAFRKVYRQYLEVLSEFRCYQFWVRKTREAV